MRFNNLNLEWVYFITIFLLVFLININSINLPYHWDDFNYVIPAVDYVYNNSPTIFLWEYGLGHPPFFFILAGLIFKIFGDSTWIGHLIIIIFSFLAVLFTYLTGKELFSRKVGILASLLLVFTPIFASYSALFYLEMPLTALIIMAIYFSIKNRSFLSILFGSLAVLTKEAGVVAVLGIFLAKLIKDRKKSLIYLIPIFVFLLLMLLNKYHYDHFLFPISTSLIKIDPIKNILISFIILKSIFFDQFRWILTSTIIIGLISRKSLKKSKKLITLAIIISTILFIIIYFLNFLKLEAQFPNANEYINLLKSFSIIFVFLFFIFITHLKEFFDIYLNNKLYEIYIPALLLIGMHFLIIPFPPRYALPIYPILFLTFGFSISRLFKKWSYLFSFFVIILFIFGHHGESGSVGFTLENNLEYQDFIYVRQQATRFISQNYQNATILTAYPMSMDLQHTYGKYVERPLNVVTFGPYPGLTNKNYTQFLDPKTVQKEPINLSEIDIYYYSPQEFKTKPIIELKNKLNLTLIKRFELNNKSTEIYLVNH